MLHNRMVFLIFLYWVLPFMVSAQETDADSVFVTNYRSESGLPGVLVDFYMDNSGLLWLTGQSSNTKIFDGKKFRKIGWASHRQQDLIQFTSIIGNGSGPPSLVSWPNRMIARVNADGNLEQQNSIPENYFVKGNPFYFDWKQFIESGATTLIRNQRTGIMADASQGDFFKLFNDSTFLYRKADSFYLYHHSGKSMFSMPLLSAVGMQLLSGDFLYTDNNKLYRFDPELGSKELVSLVGDIAKERPPAASERQAMHRSMQLINGEVKHLIFNNKLFRLYALMNHRFEGRFVCTLNFIHSPIDKIDYYNGPNITVLLSQLEGLFIVSKSKFPLHPINVRFDSLKKGKVFYPIIADRKGRLQTVWASFFPGKKKIQTFQLDEPLPFGMHIDSAGHFWTTGKENRVFELDSNRKKIREYLLPTPGLMGVDFEEDEQGNMYLLANGNISKFGQQRFTSLAFIDSFYKNEEGLSLQNMCYAGHGKFFVGSNKGLFSFDVKDNLFRKIPKLKNHFVLNSRRLDDSIFIFTLALSDTLFIKVGEDFSALPLGKELGSREIMAVQPDKRGRVWFSTENGLYVTTRDEILEYGKGVSKTVFFYKYDKSDGLPEMEFNGGLNPSSAIDADGWLAFNSIGGLVLFNQDSVNQEFPFPGIRLSREYDNLNKWVHPADTLQIENDQSKLNLDVIVAYYGKKENLRLEYRVDGANDDWTRIEEGKLTLGKLDNGSHRIVLRLKTGFGFNNYFTTAFQIYVKPFFYQKMQFKILVGSLSLMLLIFIVVNSIRLRTRNQMIKQQTAAILKANASLEVKSRNLEEFARKMEAANQEILLSKEQLQDNMLVKERLMSLILHDLRSPLYSQSIILNQMIQGPALSVEDMRTIFIQMKQSNDAILKFTQDFLTWYSSQRNGFMIKGVSFVLEGLIDEILLMYKEIASLKNIEIFSAGCKETMFTDRNILEVILRNLLDNAIKYTERGSVNISCHKTADSISIRVEDTGPGIPIQILEQLEMYYSLETQYSLATFGYRFIFTLSQKIGALLYVTNKKGTGASITIVLPIT